MDPPGPLSRRPVWGALRRVVRLPRRRSHAPGMPSIEVGPGLTAAADMYWRAQAHHASLGPAVGLSRARARPSRPLSIEPAGCLAVSAGAYLRVARCAGAADLGLGFPLRTLTLGPGQSDLTC